MIYCRAVCCKFSKAAFECNMLIVVITEGNTAHSRGCKNISRRLHTVVLRTSAIQITIFNQGNILRYVVHTF